MNDIQYLIQDLNRDKVSLNVYAFDAFTEYRYKPGLLEQLNGIIIDASYLMSHEIIEQIKSNPRQNYIIDNISMMPTKKSEDYGMSRAQELRTMTETLRSIALEYDTIIHIINLTYKGFDSSQSSFSKVTMMGGNSLMLVADNVLFITGKEDDVKCQLIKSRTYPQLEYDAEILLKSFLRRIKLNRLLQC